MARYILDITEPAEAVYRGLRRKVKVSLVAGETESPCAVALDEIKGFFEILALAPLKDEWRLAGVFNNFFRIRGEASGLCYLVSQAERKVLIISITDDLDGDPDPKEISALCAYIITSRERDIQKLFGVSPPTLNQNTDVQ